MPPSKDMNISLGEKLGDVFQKLSGVATILWGALPGGKFQMATESIRGHPLKV